jgi:hypothetical protein
MNHTKTAIDSALLPCQQYGDGTHDMWPAQMGTGVHQECNQATGTAHRQWEVELDWAELA